MMPKGSRVAELVASSIWIGAALLGVPCVIAVDTKRPQIRRDERELGPLEPGLDMVDPGLASAGDALAAKGASIAGALERFAPCVFPCLRTVKRMCHGLTLLEIFATGPAQLATFQLARLSG